MLDLATNYDIIEKSGAWYAYQGEKIGQGRENAKAFLDNNPEIMQAIEAEVKARLFPEQTENDSEEG